MNGQANNSLASNSKSKKQQALKNKKVLEQLGEISSEALNTAINEGSEIARNAVDQILGRQVIEPGQSVNVSETLSQKQEENKSLENKVFEQNNLINEIQSESHKKLNELRVRLQALMSEAAKMANSAANLSEQTKVAVFQKPAEVSEYQIAFVQNLIEYIQTFRKKVDSAVNWMAESNKRAQKKNYWAKYKKHGASMLLSSESYNSRSAG